MDQENIDYLYNIGKRVKYYFSIRKKAIDYILTNKITDNELSVHIVLMSAIWAATQIGEDLTQEDLLVLFGLTSNFGDEFNHQTLKMHPDQSHLSLEEIFKAVVENFK
jgi:hypothetical protein